MNSDTTTSPGIGALPGAFSNYGGIIVDMLGTNGQRITAQISPGSLFKGSVQVGQAWLALGSVSGFTQNLGLLGTGIAKCNIRVTLSDGDSGSPNPIYSQVFGANTMPYSGPYAMVPGGLASVPDSDAASQPPGWDFDAGTNLFIGIDPGNGVPINCGYMGQTTTFRLDSNGATDRTFTGFPGVYALDITHLVTLESDPRYPAVCAAIAALPATESAQFAVTGWFSVPAGQLAGMHSALLSSGTLTVGLHDISPGDQYYDFQQGVGLTIINIPAFAPSVLTFTATPSTINGQTQVVLAWTTQNVTSVSINNNVGNNLAANGTITVLVSATTTFALTAVGSGGSTTATVTVTNQRPAVSIQSFSASPATAPYTGHALLQWAVSNADQFTIDGVVVAGNSAISSNLDTAGTHVYTLIATQGTGAGQTSATATTTMSLTGLPLSIATASPLPVVASTQLTITPITFQALGGTGAYHFSASGLPSGLAMSTGGVLSGTLPAGPSTQYTFAVTVTDSNTTPATATKTFSLPFGLCPLQIITTQSDLNDVLARSGQAYSFQFQALYGIGTQTWTLVSGVLPPGVTLSSTGQLTGTPGKFGYFDFTIQVAAGSETNQASYELMVRMDWTLTTPFQNIFYRVLDQNGNVVIGANGQPLTNDPYPDSAGNEYFGQMVVAFTLGASDFTVTDVRQRGGGLAAPYQNIPAADGFWDLGYWDGKPYPLGGGLAVYLPQTILNDLTRDQIAAKLTAILPLGTLPVVRYYAPDGEESL